MHTVFVQSIKNLAVTGIGFGLGLTNTVFLFTRIMQKQEYGLIAYLIAASNLLWPLLAAGAPNTLIKYFSSYGNTKDIHRFLSTMLFFPAILSLAIGGIALLQRSKIMYYFTADNPDILPYIWLIGIMGISICYFEIFYSWVKVQLKTVLGNILREIYLRLCTFFLLLFFYLKWIALDGFVYGMALAYVSRMLIMAGYALAVYPIAMQLAWPKNYRSVFRYSILIVIANAVATWMIDLDKTMIARFLPISAVANYSICAYIASVIGLPLRAMHQITYPITAKLIHAKHYGELKLLYSRTSLHLSIVSGLLLVLILCNMHQFFLLIPASYSLFPLVVLCIGLVKFIDNILGINNAILYTSAYYVWILVLGLLVVGLALLLHWIGIPRFGPNGAAFVTFLASALYSFSKLLLVKLKFGMQPFDSRICKTILSVFVTGVLFYAWEFPYHPLVNIFLKSTMVVLVYILLCYTLAVSPEVRKEIDKWIFFKKKAS